MMILGPCGPFEPNGVISYALFGCGITPIRVLFLLGAGLFAGLVGGRGLFDISDGSPRGVLRLLSGLVVGLAGIALFAGAI